MSTNEEQNVVDFIVGELIKYTNDPLIYLQKNRNWADNGIINNVVFLKNEFQNIESSFLKDVYLKFLVSEKLNDLDYKDKDLLKNWIVKEWGGIKTHKDFQSLEGAKEKKSFDRISSWSKIASFENIENEIIYDSRVVYSLNWLIYKFNQKHLNKITKYFVQPSGRNKLLTLLPVDSIINISHIKLLKTKTKGEKVFKDVYIEKKECYEKACELIKDINEKLFQLYNIEELPINPIQASSYPFFTEMLLFEIADKEIFEEIKNSIKISMN